MADLPKVDRNFVGAIKLANWIKRNNFYIAKGDKVNVADGCVWPAFKNVVQKHRGFPITLSFRPDLIGTSFSLRQPPPKECWKILIPASFNFCHRRFAICKELCHILYEGSPVHVSYTLSDLSEALGTGAFVRTADTRAQSPLFMDKELSSENFCFLLALEILIPIKDRDRINADVYVKQVSHYDVAFRLRIPETLVRFFVESGYNAAFKRAGGVELTA